MHGSFSRALTSVRLSDAAAAAGDGAGAGAEAELGVHLCGSFGVGGSMSRCAPAVLRAPRRAHTCRARRPSLRSPFPRAVCAVGQVFPLTAYMAH